MSVNNPKCPENQSKTPRSLNVRLSTRITRLPIVAMNDYRHFATGPYSRGESGHKWFYVVESGVMWLSG